MVPTGCPLYMSDFVRTRECCEIRGVPLEPTACTALDESHVIYGGEGKLLEAVKEAYAKYHPDLIVILSCCCSGIIGDDVESIAREAEKLVGCRVLALRSEGFGGDFRSGYEDAFRLIMELMEPPQREDGEGQSTSSGPAGAHPPPSSTGTWTRSNGSLARSGIKINAIIAGGCTVEQIRHAREVELNASWCYDWGQKLGDLMQERFGIPYSKTGQPYGLEATKEWLLGVATPLGMEEKALEVIERETREVEPDLAYLKQALDGEDRDHRDTEFPGPIRALSLARMAEEFGAHPVVINVHPYTIKERMPSIKFILETGVNPEIILTKGLFRLGSFRSSKETEDELEAIVRNMTMSIFFGNSARYPPCPVVNLTLMNPVFQPQYGFRGIRNIAALVRQALEKKDLPRSRLFRGMLYGTRTK